MNGGCRLEQQQPQRIILEKNGDQGLSVVIPPDQNHDTLLRSKARAKKTEEKTEEKAEEKAEERPQ